MRLSFDSLGDQALERINAIAISQEAKSDGRERSNNARRSSAAQNISTRDCYTILRDNTNDEVIGRLWAQVNTVPEWVWWEQIARGQDCFYRYGGPALAGLAYQSLLGGMVRHSFPS